MRKFFIVGHRGMGPTSTLPTEKFSKKTLPENSIAAIKRALKLGADGVEIDVHVNKDQKIAVIHDDNLNKKVFGAIGTKTKLVKFQSIISKILKNTILGMGIKFHL